MLDVKGISLAEVEKRYPRSFQILGYDAPLDVNTLGKPLVIPTFEMMINVVLTLLMMKPGQYPSVPDLGIDIESYLWEYSDDPSLPGKIEAKIKEQCSKLQISGVEVKVSMDRTNVDENALVVAITGTDRATYGSDHNQVIIGITYDKLKELYIKKYYI
jgi:hypothetical protein